MRIEEMIASVQDTLGVEVDGKAGPRTWGAIYARLVRKKIDGQTPAKALAHVDPRSEVAPHLGGWTARAPDADLAECARGTGAAGLRLSRFSTAFSSISTHSTQGSTT